MRSVILVAVLAALAIPAAAQTTFPEQGYTVRDPAGRVLETVRPSGFQRWDRYDAFGRRIGRVHEQANGDLAVSNSRGTEIGLGVNRGQGVYDFYDAYGTSVTGRAPLPRRQLGGGRLVLDDRHAPLQYVPPLDTLPQVPPVGSTADLPSSSPLATQ